MAVKEMVTRKAVDIQFDKKGKPIYHYRGGLMDTNKYNPMSAENRARESVRRGKARLQRKPLAAAISEALA